MKYQLIQIVIFMQFGFAFYFKALTGDMEGSVEVESKTQIAY